MKINKTYKTHKYTIIVGRFLQTLDALDITCRTLDKLNFVATSDLVSYFIVRDR